MADKLIPTPSQTVGPFFHLGMARAEWSDLTADHPAGEKIAIEGQVIDGDGAPVPDAIIELWQANAAGRYNHPDDKQTEKPIDPHFRGFGRVATDAEGRFRVVTIKPGAYPWRNTPNAWRPAHIHFGVFGAGFVTRVVTQMYFPGDPLLLYDPIFQSTADAAARERLICAYDPALSEAEWALGYRFDMVLRGRAATPSDPA